MTLEPDWIKAFTGGLVIGLASILFFLLNGRIFGVSGILGGLLIPIRNDRSWRLALISGLVASGFILRLMLPESFDTNPSRSIAVSTIAGFLVGFGTRMGNGCTSGHGICGISRFSLRSIAATLIFLATGIFTATIVSIFGAFQ